MYNPKDIQFVGKHDYDRENNLSSMGWDKTFSVGVFKWELKNNGKEMKKSKAIVRVSGLCSNANEVFKMAECVVAALDNGDWDGRKTVKV